MNSHCRGGLRARGTDGKIELSRATAGSDDAIGAICTDRRRLRERAAVRNLMDCCVDVALRVPVLLQTARGILTHSLLYHTGDEP